MTLRPFEQILSTSDLRHTADTLGSHFFSRDTMRFFDSRLTEQIRTLSDSSGYFVTSERYPDSPRHYTIRRYDVIRDTRSSDSYPFDRITFDTLDTYPSIKKAKAALKAL